MQMNVRLDTAGIRQSIVACVQVVVRVIEMTDLPLYHDLSWAEQVTLRMVQAHYLSRVRGLLADMPAEIANEILAMSEKASGAVMGFSQN
jgi:hypothetical protein